MTTANTEHTTTVREMGDARNPIYAAECSCGWESSNLPTHRPEAVRDARAHRANPQPAK